MVAELQSRRAQDRLLHECGQRSVPAAAASDVNRDSSHSSGFQWQENLAPNSPKSRQKDISALTITMLRLPPEYDERF